MDTSSSLEPVRASLSLRSYGQRGAEDEGTHGHGFREDRFRVSEWPRTWIPRAPGCDSFSSTTLKVETFGGRSCSSTCYLRIRGLTAWLFGFLGRIVASGQTKPDSAKFKELYDAVGTLVTADTMDWAKTEAAAEALLTANPTRFKGYVRIMRLTWRAELACKRELEQEGRPRSLSRKRLPFPKCLSGPETR